MTSEELIKLAEQFNLWLKEMADLFNIDESDVQEIIKAFIQ